MKKLMVAGFVGFMMVLVGCGDDDILNEIPQEEPVAGEKVVVVLPEGEEIPATVVEPDPEPEPVVDPEDDCPEEYAIADMVILDCGENMALVAIGKGCLKSLQIFEGEEAKEWCD